jgi:tRNA-specific 2-thiouridylase
VSIAPPTAPIRAEVQIRYRSQPQAVTVIPVTDTADEVKLIFDQPIFGITPGQAAVWYDGEQVLGGGIIQRPSPQCN